MAREREYPDTDAEARDLAERDRREGKSASTQAGEFVREEMHHVREGKHGARSSKQAIAIGLSKARRAGVDLAPPKEGTAPEETIEAAQRETAAAPRRRRPSAKRSRATTRALRREGRKASLEIGARASGALGGAPAGRPRPVAVGQKSRPHPASAGSQPPSAGDGGVSMTRRRKRVK
jgi:hypothetical protein